MLSELRADISRHEKLTNPAVWPLLVYRVGRAVNTLPGPLSKIGSRIYGLACLGLELTTGTVLYREMEIGSELHLIHGGNIHVHPKVVIGDRVSINHNVTIGMQHRTEGLPRIGNDVLIGAGATILGPVTIGDGAVIAAGSLVINDVPPGRTALGVPARPLPEPFVEGATTGLRAVPTPRSR